MRIAPAVSLIALMLSMPALAQPAVSAAAEAAPAAPSAPAPAPADGPNDDDNEIIVTAQRVFGQVETASTPIVELDEQQVASYGASSIDDLISQLAPEVGSGRGRGGMPVILVNGQRITNFREIRRYPPEAIKKVEILPEEVALKFGYQPDQRVINFILKDNFRSREAEAEYGMPTRGGYGIGEIELSQLSIKGNSRLNASVDYKNTGALTEADRGVIQTDGSVPSVAGDPNPAAYRTLVPKDSTLELNFTSTSGLGKDGSGGQLTFNTQVIHEISTSLSGLDTVLLTDPSGNTALRSLDAKPITRRTQTDTYSFGSGYNRMLGEYQFSTTLDASYVDTDSSIGRQRTASDPAVQALIDDAAAGTLAIGGPLPEIPGLGSDRSQNRAYSLALKSTLIGNPIALPAGDIGITLTTGYNWSRNESEDTRLMTGTTALVRGDLNAGANISIPLTSRRDDVLAALGDITLNLAGGLDYLSDFGTLGNWTGGLVWKPSDSLTLQGSYIEREAAPGLSQLGGPTQVSYNVPLYDFRTGQSVLVTQTSGGNPDLVAEKQRDWKLSANYDLHFLDRANIVVEYYRNHSSNVTASFPLLTPAIEAAFPGRVTRDAAGQLLAVDIRPVTFAETRSDRLRYGFNLFGRVGKPDPASEREGGGPPMGGRPVRSGQPSGSLAPDPGRFAKMREDFCATPPGQIPDISALPQRLQDRLKGEDGKPDPAKIALVRQRFCSADAARRFDPARMAQLREKLCSDAGKEPDLSALPPEMLDRLKGPDGKVDPAKLKQLRDRICAAPGANGEAGGRSNASQDGNSSQASRGGHGRRGFGPGNGQGRWNLAFYHTINLSNSILIAPGGPTLDLLDGDATGSNGGVARHTFELEGGMFYKGIGMRLSGNYATGTDVRASGVPGSSDLHFGGLATFDLRLFVALDQQKWLTGGKPGFLENARLSLRVNNIFDAHQRVTDANGVVPIRYQPALLDPTGRFVEIEFRKLF